MGTWIRRLRILFGIEKGYSGQLMRIHPPQCIATDSSEMGFFQCNEDRGHTGNHRYTYEWNKCSSQSPQFKIECELSESHESIFHKNREWTWV